MLMPTRGRPSPTLNSCTAVQNDHPPRGCGEASGLWDWGRGVRDVAALRRGDALVRQQGSPRNRPRADATFGHLWSATRVVRKHDHKGQPLSQVTVVLRGCAQARREALTAHQGGGANPITPRLAASVLQTTTIVPSFGVWPSGEATGVLGGRQAMCGGWAGIGDALIKHGFHTGAQPHACAELRENNAEFGTHRACALRVRVCARGMGPSSASRLRSPCGVSSVAPSLYERGGFCSISSA